MRESPERVVVDADVAEFIGRGVSLVVATRDGHMVPATTRGWGAVASGDGAAVTVCIPAQPGSAVRSNLESNGALAMCCTLPSTYRCVQLKGTAMRLEEPSHDQLERAERHLEDFLEETLPFGYTDSYGHRVSVGPIDLAVTFAVEELYDQTPGPSAGRHL